MDFTESLINEYAKKIFRFAYSKTNGYHNAEDLSQDIIVALCDTTIADKGIENMDAYIYRICCYSWSKYLRKNKPQWEALNNATAFDYMESDDDIEESYIQKELRKKLRQEVMYLSKTKRDITVMFYYENKSGDEISKILGIPASTVRWHLSQAKIDLKERIEMTKQSTNGIYQPIKLCAGRNGWGCFIDPCGLHDDVLIQNICWICHGKALTIEEIARTLGIAAIYLEDKIEKLLYMDYMKTVGKNKYQTNFFIPDADYQLTDRKFHLENTLPIAKQFYDIIEKALQSIKKIGFDKGSFNDNFLKWNFIAVIESNIIHKMGNMVIERKSLQHSSPKRRDGSKRWANASVPLVDIIKNTPNISDELKEFCLNNANGLNYPSTEQMKALQYDLGFITDYRQLSTTELSKLKRVYSLISNNETLNDYDKEIISDLISKGYVSNIGSELKICVPYLSHDQMVAVNTVLQKCYNEMLDENKIYQASESYIDTMNKKIPSFVDENERRHLLTSFSPFATIFWVLYKNGYLKEPTAEEKKCICTVVWEN
jgi:RNA polymerase sigma factor (sigma-70 family)